MLKNPNNLELKRAVRTFIAYKALIVSTIVILLCAACDSKKGKAPIQYPEADSTAAKIYIDKCGQCHVAPHPNAHTTSMWPSVLTRMQLRMKTNKAIPPTRIESSIILGYLQRHAQP